MKSAVDNAADPKQVGRAQNKQKQRRQESALAWKDVLQTKAGRRVLLEILEYCNVFRSQWEASEAIHRNEGMRIVGLHVLEEIAAADIHVLPAMLAEPWLQQERDRMESAARAATAPSPSDELTEE